MLEPSAGTGLLAVFAQRTGARLVLNEIDPARAEMLAAAFPGVAVTRHDAELIHDLLAPTVRPTAVLINPPFFRSIGRHADPLAAFRHLRAALMRLGAGGRCAAILLDRVSTSSRAWANRRGRDRQHHRVAMISLIERKGRGSHDPCDIDITWRSEPRFRPPSMAHAKDVAAVIQSALDEIGVTGQFDVSMDGEKAIKPLGTPSGDDRHVDVVVDDLLKKTAKPTGDD